MNILTIDCEDFFSLPAFSKLKPNIDWDQVLNSQIDLLIKILNQTRKTKATFFVVGEIAQRNPQIVKKIAKENHQIGSHLNKHSLVYRMTKKEFNSNLKESINTIEAIINKKVSCFRAPFWSYRKKNTWFWDVLLSNKIEYDSSVFPKFRFLFNNPLFERFMHNVNDKILELPPSTIRIFGINVPFSGGIYFRILPYWLIRKFIRTLNKRGRIVLLYFHPWELDPSLERIRKISLFNKFILYHNNKKALVKFQCLINEFNFTSIEEYIIQKKTDKTQ